jgi:hypothetical protein
MWKGLQIDLDGFGKWWVWELLFGIILYFSQIKYKKDSIREVSINEKKKKKKNPHVYWKK